MLPFIVFQNEFIKDVLERILLKSRKDGVFVRDRGTTFLITIEMTMVKY